MTDRNRSQNYYERENYNTFQDHGNRRKYKDHYKDKYRDENFYDSDRYYDMDDSHGRDRSYSRDRPYSRDRLWDYCRDVYKEESHKYKRRSRDYYAVIYENRHGMDKYECQFRNDNYDIIRGRPKEKPCSCGDQSCDSFYSELEKWYSSRVAVNVQDLHNLPTNIVDELELSDIHFIEEHILEKEKMETQEMEEYFVELSDKQEIDKEMVVLPNMPQKTFCEQEECVENENLWYVFTKPVKMVHTDEKELEVPEINKVEIKELPREMKLEKPIELDKSKIHPKQKKVLTSRAVKRVNLTGLEKGKICRPPPRPPDRGKQFKS